MFLLTRSVAHFVAVFGVTGNVESERQEHPDLRANRQSRPSCGLVEMSQLGHSVGGQPQRVKVECQERPGEGSERGAAQRRETCRNRSRRVQTM